MSWQTMDSAPKVNFNPEWPNSGVTRVLLSNCIGGPAYIGSFRYTLGGKGRWINGIGRVCKPAFWQPLPEPPQWPA